MRTQVLIIGGGPSGLLLSQLLSDINIDCLVLEKHTKEHVLSRIRAGVLEEGTIKLLKKAGIFKRIKDEGFSHDGIFLSLKNRGFRMYSILPVQKNHDTKKKLQLKNRTKNYYFY